MPYLPLGVPARALDANGDPVSGAKLYVYDAGTTTPATVYSDAAMTTAHASPIVADANGVWAPVFASDVQDYKVDATDADGAALPGFPIDNIAVVQDNDSEGTYTPTLSFGGTEISTSGSGAYSLQTGVWFLTQDEFMWLEVNLVLTAKGTATGDATISFPPGYEPKGTPAGYLGCPFARNMNGLNGWPFGAATGGSNDHIQLRELGTGAAGDDALDEGHFTDTSRISLYGWVRVQAT